jgi:hypothetical protein
MKKTLIALAALASTAAMAQVAITGSFHGGILATGAAGATGDAQVSTLGGGVNAINMAAVEDLGGGMNAGLTAQIRFNAATGDRNSAGTGNALFHAMNAYVGGGFGTVRIGKIAEASNCGFDPWGCTGGASLSAGTGVSALIAAGTQASSLSYTTPTIAGFSASYQTTLTTRVNERTVLNLSYTAGPLSLQYLRSESSANVAGDPALLMTSTTPYSPAALTAAPITDADGQGQSIGVSYDLKVAKLSFVNAQTKNPAKTTTASVNSIGLTVPMGATSILAGYNKNSKAAATADTKLSIGVAHSLSKRTTVGADFFKAEAVGAGSGYALRIRHTF